MQTWFSCKVKYFKVDEHGKQVRFSDNYLVEAINFTEAETRIFEIMEEYGNGDITVSGISKANFAEVLDAQDGQYWYKAKIGWEETDEKSGRTSRIAQHFLMAANSIMDTCERLEAYLSTMMVPFEISAVSLSNILDVFPLFSEDTEEAIPDNLRPLTDEERSEKPASDDEA